MIDNLETRLKGCSCFREMLAAADRKERPALLRQALGDPEVDPNFLNSLHTTLSLPLPGASEAWWWGTDFHLDWLDDCVQFFKHRSIAPRSNVRRTVLDVDLLIVGQRDLFAIEAKGEGHWRKHQLRQKLKRLDSIFPGDGQFTSKCGRETIQAHLMLASSKRSSVLDDLNWPAWSQTGGKHNWLDFKVGRASGQP